MTWKGTEIMKLKIVVGEPLLSAQARMLEHADRKSVV